MATTQHVAIGFPMPPVPMDGSPRDPRQFIGEGGDVLDYYMLFTASETVGYITTTAAHWKGPIGQFNLTIVKDKPVAEYNQVSSETAFCGRAGSSETVDAFTWTKTDFVPERDISVVWYGIYDYGE